MNKKEKKVERPSFEHGHYYDTGLLNNNGLFGGESGYISAIFIEL